MTQAVFALCPLLCSSQAAWLCKLLSNRSLSGSRSPLCACLFAQYIAESSTKEPGYLKELYVTKSHTVCHHNTCMRRPQTHWALTQGGRRLSVKITDGTVWVNAWAMWVLLTKPYSKKKPKNPPVTVFHKSLRKCFLYLRSWSNPGWEPINGRKVNSGFSLGEQNAF